MGSWVNNGMGRWKSGCLRLLLLMSLAGNVFAGDDVSVANSGQMPTSTAPLDLFAQFKPLTIASGTFVQNKYFTVLKNPVTSTGELYLDQALGFVWHTSKPIASTMILKDDGLFAIDHRQQQTRINNATPIATVLMSALSGDLTALESQFSLTASSTSPTCIELTPKDDTIAKVMRVIKLCGGDTVEHLVLFETSGNRTEIELNLSAVAELPKAIREQL
jgi:outer membrane lipoprotein-sorting protein